MAGLRRSRVDQVRVAAFPTACATFAVDAIHRLHDSHPNVVVEVLQAEPPEALPALAAGEVDLAVVFDDAPGRPGRPGLAWEVLGSEEVVAVLPGRDPRAGRPALTLADLAHDTVIAGCPTCQARFGAAAAGAGVRPSLHHQVTDDYVLMQAMVAAGQGVAVLPTLALAAHHRDDVVAVPLAPAMTRRTALALRVGEEGRPALAATVRALRAAIAATVAQPVR